MIATCITKGKSGGWLRSESATAPACAHRRLGRQRFADGFTLIEMVVAVALFSVVISIAIPTLFIVVNTSGRAEAVQTTVDNVSFAIDSIAAAARLGSSFYCTSNTPASGVPLPTGTADCTSGGSILVFTDSSGDRIAYRYDSTAGTLEVREDTGNWLALTSSEVRIAHAQFYVDGSTTFDGKQPNVRLIVRGAARNEPNAPDFYLQSSITQYVADKGFGFRKIPNPTNTGTQSGFSDQFGNAIAAIGDVDNDGVGDLAVGAPNDDTGGTDFGAVYVLLMNRNGTVKASQKIPGINVDVSMSSRTEFGISVASVGDLDGNNVPDIAIGAGLDDTGGTDRGAVHIVFLKSNGTASSSVKIASGVSDGPTLGNGDQFGVSLASLGDLNNDGVGDLAVGAYEDDTGGSNRGAVHILFMRDDGTVSSATKIASSVNGGPNLANTAQFGRSVAAVGDVDADGVNDIMVGAVSDDTCGTDQGSIFTLLMNTNGTVDGTVQISSCSGGGPALADGSQFGRAIASLDDIDGDGNRDVLAGLDLADIGGTDRGSFYVMFMGTAAQGVLSTRQIASDTNGGPALTDGDRFGFSLAPIGDLNRDGRPDFAVGSIRDDTSGVDRGAIYIVFGR